MDLKTLDLEALKAGRPDLIAVIEKSATEAAKAESAKTLEALVKSQTEAIETRLRAELKLEKKKAAADDDDEDDMKEMIAAAKRHGYVVSDATRPGDQRYGGGKGRKGKGEEKSEGSDADSQDSSNGPSEQEMLSFFQKNNIKVEKKAAKKDDEDDDVEERFSGLQAQIRDLQKVNEQTSNRAKQLEESARTTEIKSYIFEKVKDEKKYKNALTERLLTAGLKTRDEVDARIPVEKAAIDKLLAETSGGRGEGHTGKEEPTSREAEQGKFKTKGGMTLTEAELRQRQLAGLPTELVEQAS